MSKEKKIFGITALFNSPDEIISAVNKVNEKGYKKYDVHTPYPLHGMDNAMKLPPSKLGFVTLIFGLTGAAIALLSIWWAMTKDYPMIIGGKPFFALPAFIPVTFEVTVLLATLSTVIGMIAFFFYFPHNAHPLHDTEYMKKVSGDKYGICIEANDEQFDEREVNQFLTSLNSYSVQTVYWPEKEIFKIFDIKFIGFLVGVAILVSGATYLILNKVLYITPFDWMMKQPRVNAQSYSTFFKDGFGMRMPVKGTVARGFIPYEFTDLKTQPENPLINPITPSKEIIELGKKKFLTYCSPCHGNLGNGDSRLRGQFPNPPSLHSDKVRGWKDGNIYHVIVNGQNIMPSYASQLTRDERWAIVHYIRVLQKAGNASELELSEIKKGL